MSAKAVSTPPPSISLLQDKALELISSSSGGLLQSELKGLLGIESSKCSKIVLKLLGSGHIKRERNHRTYLLKLNRTQKWPKKRALNANIDSYLTEIYMLYLIRGITN
jgi:DNA-binding MarR family transcriptional regulator